jgi:hypothetical protein
VRPRALPPQSCGKSLRFVLRICHTDILNFTLESQEINKPARRPPTGRPALRSGGVFRDLGQGVLAIHSPLACCPACGAYCQAC